MGWMAPLRHLGAKVLVGENQSADKEHRSDHPLHRQLRRCLQLHGFAASSVSIDLKESFHTFRVGLAFDL